MRPIPFTRILARAALSGSDASAASATACVTAAMREGRRPAAPINAIGHGVWDTKFQCTPERLMPGYEHKLSRKAVYVSFGIGLALTRVLSTSRRRTF